MNEIARIQDQLRRAHDGDAWHGPSLCSLLTDVRADRAAARPIPGVHSISEIVGHITAWQRVVVRRLGGERVVDIPEPENWPAAVGDAAAWKGVKDRLQRSHVDLLAAIGQLGEAQLENQVDGMNYSVYVMLHGAVQHLLYHAG